MENEANSPARDVMWGEFRESNDENWVFYSDSEGELENLDTVHMDINGIGGETMAVQQDTAQRDLDTPPPYEDGQKEPPQQKYTTQGGGFEDISPPPSPQTINEDEMEEGDAFHDLLDLYPDLEDFLGRDENVEAHELIPPNSPIPLATTSNEKDELVFTNNLIPEGLRWDELDELAQEILNPDLATRMRAMRMAQEEDINPNEPLMLFSELQVSKIQEKYGQDKRKMSENMLELERKVEKHWVDFQAAQLENEILIGENQRLRTEVVVTNQELGIQRIKGANLVTIINAWVKLCLEKDTQITRLRESLAKERKHASMLRTKISEENHKRRKYSSFDK